MLEMKPGLPVHFMAGAAFLFIIFFFVDLVLLLEAEELDEQQQLALLTAVKVIQQAYHGSSRKRMHFNDDNDEDNADSPPTKKKYTRYDRERAHRCVMQDYLGPMPIFDDRQFEHFFRISRGIYETIRCICCSADCFFTAGKDCTGRYAISTDVKILAALKRMAYGVSASAFRDYFQMGESTAELCCEKVAHIISHCDELRSKFLRRMTRADARRVSSLHEQIHGFLGMQGPHKILLVHFRWAQKEFEQNG